MPDFVCRMALPTGEIVERSFVAESEESLRRDLEDKDYLVLDLKRRSRLLHVVANAFKIRAAVSGREFLFFNQEMSALLRAGLPILTSLDILIDRRANPTFKRALIDIRDRVKGGEALSEAFAAQEDLFPRLYSSSLASGERSGELPTVLKRYIAYSRSIMAIRRKVVSALIYPTILLVMSVALVALMVFYIIPKFNAFLADFGTDLPLITQMLVSTALFLQGQWKLVLAAVGGSTLGFLLWRKSAQGRATIDRLQLRIPVIGGIVHDWAQNRFTRTLATLVSGGIPLVTSLDLAARAVGNAHFESLLLEVAKRVREGQSLWESLERTGLISGIAVEMIKVGESTGSLVEMLDNASEFSEEEIDHRLGKMITLIEPLMLVFMAVVVAGMLLAIYLPLIRAAGQSRF